MLYSRRFVYNNVPYDNVVVVHESKFLRFSSQQKNSPGVPPYSYGTYSTVVNLHVQAQVAFFRMRKINILPAADTTQPTTGI